LFDCIEPLVPKTLADYFFNAYNEVLLPFDIFSPSLEDVSLIRHVMILIILFNQQLNAFLHFDVIRILIAF